jgi:hypothetical protein
LEVAEAMAPLINSQQTPATERTLTRLMANLSSGGKGIDVDQQQMNRSELGIIALPSEIIFKIVENLDDVTAICFALTCKEYHAVVLNERKTKNLNSPCPGDPFRLCYRNPVSREAWLQNSALSQQLYTWPGRRCLFGGQSFTPVEKRKQDAGLSTINTHLYPTPRMDHLQHTHENLRLVLVEMENLIKRRQAGRNVNDSSVLLELKSEWESGLRPKHARHICGSEAEKLIWLLSASDDSLCIRLGSCEWD